MKESKSVPLDLEELYKEICKCGDTTSPELAAAFDCSTSKVLTAVHELEEMHPGTIMVHNLGISACRGKSKEDIDRFLLTAGRNQSILRRIKHIATYSLGPAQKRIGPALLLKALPERKVFMLENSINFLKEHQRKEDEGVVREFDFDEGGKMMRGASAGAE